MIGRTAVECRDGVKICFNSSKAYWKPRVTLDVVIVLHSDHNCFEVIAYNPESDKEASRLYIDADALRATIDPSELDQKLAEKKEYLLRTKCHIDQDDVLIDVTGAVMVNHLLARLTVDTANGGLVIALCSRSGDNADMTLLLSKADALVPMRVTFRKKVSSMELLSMLNTVHAETDQLREATHLAVLSTCTLDKFRFTQRVQAQYSPARVRWMKAINRVLIQNYVRGVTKRLEELEQQRIEIRLLRKKNKENQPPRPRILRKTMDNCQLPPLSASKKIPAKPSNATVELPYVSIHTVQHRSTSFVAPTRPATAQPRRTKSAADAPPTAVGQRRLSIATDFSLPSIAGMSGRDSFSVWGVTSCVDIGRSSSSDTSNTSVEVIATGKMPSLIESYATKSSIYSRPMSAKPAYVLSDVIARTMKYEPPV